MFDPASNVFVLDGVGTDEEGRTVRIHLQGTVLNHPPVADAGPDLTLACASPQGNTLVLDGGASHDPDSNDTITHYQWFKDGQGLTNASSVSVLSPIGETFYDLHVYDRFLASDRRHLSIKVVELPPTAHAGLDQVLECTSPDGAMVQLDGSLSSDPFGRPLTYEWRVDGAIALSGVRPAPIQLGLGVHQAVLTVTDPCAGSHSAEIRIVVQDTTPPELQVRSSLVCLWQPNHDFTRLALGREVQFTIRDACDPNPTVRIEYVTSDEAADMIGSGNTSLDYAFGEQDAELPDTPSLEEVVDCDDALFDQHAAELKREAERLGGHLRDGGISAEQRA